MFTPIQSHKIIDTLSSAETNVVNKVVNVRNITLTSIKIIYNYKKRKMIV